MLKDINPEFAVVLDPMAQNDPPLTSPERRELQRRFPHAGFWLGMLDQHPDIHPVLERLHRHADAILPVPPPPQYPPAIPPLPPAPGGPPYYPAYPGLFPAHGFYAPAQIQAPMNAAQAYYREHVVNPPPPAGNRARDRPEVDTSHVDVSVPRRDERQGDVVTRIMLRLPTDLPFEDFFDRICANMELQPAYAILGYKFSGDRASDAANRLANADDLLQAMSRAIDKIKRARTRGVVLEIYDLRPAPQVKKGASKSTKKRAHASSGGADENEPDTTISYAGQLRQLKSKLFCHKHDCHCYINPIDGEHVTLNTAALTLWAKKIMFNEATYSVPPSLKMFDHIAKRPRTGTPMKSTGGGPPINIYLSPLGDVTGKFVNVAKSPSRKQKQDDVVQDSDDDHPVSYPLIIDALRDLDQVMPLINYSRYNDAFAKNGIIYTNMALGLDVTYFVDIIGMPRPAVQAFIDHVDVLVKRAKKGKGRALPSTM